MSQPVLTCGGCGAKLNWIGALVPKGAVCIACFERNQRELEALRAKGHTL